MENSVSIVLSSTMCSRYSSGISRSTPSVPAGVWIVAALIPADSKTKHARGSRDTEETQQLGEGESVARQRRRNAARAAKIGRARGAKANRRARGTVEPVKCLHPRTKASVKQVRLL